MCHGHPVVENAEVVFQIYVHSLLRQYSTYCCHSTLMSRRNKTFHRVCSVGSCPWEPDDTFGSLTNSFRASMSRYKSHVRGPTALILKHNATRPRVHSHIQLSTFPCPSRSTDPSLPEYPKFSSTVAPI